MHIKLDNLIMIIMILLNVSIISVANGEIEIPSHYSLCLIALSDLIIGANNPAATVNEKITLPGLKIPSLLKKQEFPLAISGGEKPPDDGGTYSPKDITPTSKPTIEATPTSAEPETNTPSAMANDASVSSQINDLGGVNFTSITMNYIYLNENLTGDITFDYIFKGQKAQGERPGIDAVNSTLLASTAFVTGLTLPNNEFWVNLNPGQPNLIIDEQLGTTDVGRIMLESDLQMKRDFCNYSNPCANKTGEVFFSILMKKQNELVSECMKKFPGEIESAMNVGFKATTRHWIVPNKIYAYINGSGIYIINSTLNINSVPSSEYSYPVLINQNSSSLSKNCREELNKSAIEYGQYYKEQEERLILPYVVTDVNQDERYEDLRNVYISLALAQWYKENIGSQADIFLDSIDSSNLTALQSLDLWSPTEIWKNYVYSFKNGEFNCTQNKTIYINGQPMIEFSSFSLGGVDFARISDSITLIKGIPLKVQAGVDKAISDGFVNEKNDVLFGMSIRVDQKNRTHATGSSPGSDPYPKPPEPKKEVHAHNAEGENNTDDATDYDEGKTLHRMDETSLQDIDKAGFTCAPCPEGFSGPNEKCECWKLQCPPGSIGPNEKGECWSNETKCPPGYEGPNEKGECWKLVPLSPN